MSTLSNLWQYATFQEAAKRLVELSREALEDYVNTSEETFEFNARLASRHGLQPLDAELIESATRAIYETASRTEPRPSPDDIVTEIQEVTSVELGDDSRHLLVQLFRPRPRYDKRRIAELTSRSVLPVLDRVGATIDIRAAYESESAATADSLVTVILVRLEFDESLVGGSSHIAFQMPTYFIPQLQNELKLLFDRLENLRATLTKTGMSVGAEGDLL